VDIPPVAKRGPMIREARGVERDARAIREEIDKLRRRIVSITDKSNVECG
jgi:hypothetical protein